ncbi:MAG: ABC transporter permease, partial [Chloroflexota bacterium]
MRFHVVMAKTIGDLMSVPRTVALVAGGLVPALFWSLVVWRETFQANTMSLEMETSSLVGFFITISFLWMAGLYLAYLMVGTSGLELVDRERDKGTLLLMVSKPISRTQFLLGKFLALVLTSLLLEAIILPGSVLLFWGL